MMRGTECGLSPAPLFAGHRHKVEVPRYAWFPRAGEQEKRAGTVPGSHPLCASELVEHGPMNRVDYPGGKVRWQGVVVTFVERDVTELIILDNVLIEEAVQGTPFGGFQGFEIAARRQGACVELSHDNPPEICRETTGGGGDGLAFAESQDRLKATAQRRRGKRFCSKPGIARQRAKWWGPARP